MTWQLAKSEAKTFWSLVAGCSIGYKSLTLYINRWDKGQSGVEPNPNNFSPKFAVIVRCWWVDEKFFLFVFIFFCFIYFNVTFISFFNSMIWCARWTYGMGTGFWTLILVSGDPQHKVGMLVLWIRLKTKSCRTWSVHATLECYGDFIHTHSSHSKTSATDVSDYTMQYIQLHLTADAVNKIKHT